MTKTASEQRNFGRRLAGVTMPIRRMRTKWDRNWPCLCGSGKKYKRCCMNEINSFTASDGNASVTEVPEDIQSAIKSYREREVEEKARFEAEKKDGAKND